MTAADEIREAVAHIRKVALAATPGPWLDLDKGDRIVHIPTEDRPHEYVVDEPLQANPANGAHIALWHPDVAELVANSLALVAERMTDRGFYPQPEFEAALAVARAINATKES